MLHASAKIDADIKRLTRISNACQRLMGIWALAMAERPNGGEFRLILDVERSAVSGIRSLE